MALAFNTIIHGLQDDNVLHANYVAFYLINHLITKANIHI